MSIQTLERSKKPIALRRATQKAFTGISEGSRNKKTIDETQIAEFGRLLYSKLKDGRIMTKEEVVALVGRVSNKDEIKAREASAYISNVRGFMIHEYNEILVYVHQQGYKIAKNIERIHHTGKIGHMALKWRQRFMLTASVLNSSELQSARANYVQRLLKDEKSSGIITDQFLLEFKDNAKMIAREVRGKNA